MKFFASRLRVLSAVAGVLLLAPVARAQAVATPTAVASPAARVDAVFAPWDSTATPGCAVAVSRAGKILLEKAYGMADLEQGTVNTTDTIFEAGSVSKQFTATAVLLLVRDGKVSLDDSVRKYFPELPDMTALVTIRQMLQHTSGLRDWGDIAALSGWPRTTRSYTAAHVLDILSRQTALNFPPGTDWSYSNSGYNLAAMLVARVSGQSFADFTRVRIFEPLGMHHTSWRDDRTRIVRGRATAYDENDGRLVTLMPFEDVHGNGGLLTTVGDLLRWNEHLQSARIADQAMIGLMETSGTLSNGRTHGYGLGLNIGEYRGVGEISHGGATAGYRAFLVRYPAEHLSLALLCNVGRADPSRLAHAVADVFLESAATAERQTSTYPVTDEALSRVVGDYRGTKRGDLITVVKQKDGLRVEGGAPLVATAPGQFSYGASTAEVSPDAASPTTRIRVTASNGTQDIYERVVRAAPTSEQLAACAGTYRTAEVEAEYQVAVDGGALVLKRRPDFSVPLRPLYADAFQSPIGLVRFIRHPDGRVAFMSIGTGRAWDVRFARVTVTPAGRSSN